MKPISILPMSNSLAMTGATVEMFARSRYVTRYIRLIRNSTNQRFVPVRFASAVTEFFPWLWAGIRQPHFECPVTMDRAGSAGNGGEDAGRNRADQAGSAWWLDFSDRVEIAGPQAMQPARLDRCFEGNALGQTLPFDHADLKVPRGVQIARNSQSVAARMNDPAVAIARRPSVSCW